MIQVIFSVCQYLTDNPEKIAVRQEFIKGVVAYPPTKE